ncbi:MAG: tail fiber domain-containing protein [Bacteroidales bacterium]
MTRVISTIGAMIICIGLFAQPPLGFKYQAVVRDNAGDIVANQLVNFRLSILDISSAGPALYKEIQQVTTNDYGLANLVVGEGTVLSGVFVDIDWRTNAKFLKVEMDPSGGTTYQELGTAELMSVPYALYSGSDWLKSGDNIYYEGGYVGIGNPSPGAGLSLKSGDGYGSAIGLTNTVGGFEWRLTSWTDGSFRVVKTTGLTFSPLVIEPFEGNIGIGTSAGDMKLNVHSSSGIAYIRVSDITSGPTSGLRMGLNGSGNAFIINDEATKTLSLGTNGTSQIRISEIGRVGINELSPEMMLHIKQDVANLAIRFEHQNTADQWQNGIGTSTKNYKFYYNNLSRADISSVDGAYVATSDIKLKKEIHSLEPVLSKVIQLKPATYYYIDNTNNAGPRSTGFIAQEVEELFPDLVRESDDGYKGLVYDGFAVISIKAIQELNDKITLLEQEIEELKTMIKQ